MNFEKAFQKLARFDFKHKGIMVVFMLTVTIIFGLGILNLELETDPQGLWVSHDSEGYQQEMYFNDNYGAFFRTNQLVVTQVIHSLFRQRENKKTFYKRTTCTLWLSLKRPLIKKLMLLVKNQPLQKIFASNQLEIKDVIILHHLIYGS